MTMQTTFVPTNPAEVPYALEPGWHATLLRLAARDRIPPPKPSPRIAAVNFPTATRAGRGGGVRKLPPSANRAIIRAGLTLAQCIAKGASPRYLRGAIAAGYVVLEG